jgi:hypothetical protein
MKTTKWFAVLALLALACFAVPTNAQVTSNTATVNLTATVPESLSVSCTPSTETISGTPGATASAPTPVVCTVQYSLDVTLRSKLWMYIYPAGGSNALTGPAGSIPASDVFVGWDGYTIPCTATDPFSSSACDLNNGGSDIGSSTGDRGSPWPSGTVTESLLFGVNFPANVLVGSYSGTINIIVQAV